MVTVSEEKKFNYLWVLGGLILINLIGLDIYLLTNKNRVENGQVTSKVTNQEESSPKTKEEKQSVAEGSTGDCDEECIKKLIDEKLLGFSKIASQEETAPTPTKVSTSTTVGMDSQTKPLKEEYIVLADASAANTDWIRLNSTEKWLNTNLYGELVKASWQGWLELSGGSGMAYARLYDATNGRLVDGSLVEMKEKERGSFYSGEIALWRGQNQYYVEVRSTSGSEVRLRGAKIKLTVR